jgi:peroxiredoxin
MKTVLISILTAGILTTGLVHAAGDYSRRRAPGFSLADGHFQQHDPQDYLGKVLVLDIMSTTCPACGKLADTLVKTKAKYGDKIGVLSIVTLPDNRDTADKFANDHHVVWPILFDSGQVIMSYLKVTPSNPQIHFPHVFLIDRFGTIRNDFEGTEEQYLSVDGLSAEIEKLIK